MTEEREQLLKLEQQLRELDAPHAADILKLIRLWKSLDERQRFWLALSGAVLGFIVGVIIGKIL